MVTATLKKSEHQKRTF